MTDAAVATPQTNNKKVETIYEPIKMNDGRTVQFPGKKQIIKDVSVDEAAGTVAVRFDARNGESLVIRSTDLPGGTQLQALGHGLAQKCGDETAGLKDAAGNPADVDDMVLAIGNMIERLKKGDWAVTREAGDSFGGASVVIRAIAEVKGKSVQEVKDFLQKKLDTAKASGEALTRSDLYKSFRNPNSRTGVVIQRLEAEKLAKNVKHSAEDLLAEMD